VRGGAREGAVEAAARGRGAAGRRRARVAAAARRAPPTAVQHQLLHRQRHVEPGASSTHGRRCSMLWRRRSTAGARELGIGRLGNGSRPRIYAGGREAWWPGTVVGVFALTSQTGCKGLLPEAGRGRGSMDMLSAASGTHTDRLTGFQISVATYSSSSSSYCHSS
jgi:hypothetical protein